MVQLGLVFLLAAPAAAQGVLGIDGILSNRAENAFGVGLTLAYPVFTGTLGGLNWAAKLLGAADLEVVAGKLEPGACREIPDGDYYVDCATGTTAIPHTLAEASSPTRFYAAGYGVVDVWRVRLGGGLVGHPGSGDAVGSALIGFAASTSSFFMVELPNLSGWRLRIEVAVAGPPFLW